MGISSALLVNMGTLSPEWVAAKKLAARRVRPTCVAARPSRRRALAPAFEPPPRPVALAMLWTLPTTLATQRRHASPRRRWSWASPGCWTRWGAAPRPCAPPPACSCWTAGPRWCAATPVRYWRWRARRAAECGAWTARRPAGTHWRSGGRGGGRRGRGLVTGLGVSSPMKARAETRGMGLRGEGYGMLGLNGMNIGMSSGMSNGAHRTAPHCCWCWCWPRVRGACSGRHTDAVLISCIPLRRRRSSWRWRTSALWRCQARLTT